MIVSYLPMPLEDNLMLVEKEWKKTNQVVPPQTICGDCMTFSKSRLSCKCENV